jgi:hypothetical protein
MSVMGLAGLGFMSSGALSDMVDDDTVKQELAVAYQYAWIGMVIFGVSIACAGLGLFGAIKYKGWMVIVAAVWHCVNSVLSLIGGDLGGALVNGCFAYPHVVFYQEMRKGIMTEENYPNEIHSCCCV